MSEFQVEDDRILALERTHGLRYVTDVRGLAQDIESVLLDLARARTNLTRGGTRLWGRAHLTDDLADAILEHEQPEECNVHP